MRANIAPNQKMFVTEPNLSSTEPITGPTINPNPKNAPINPKFLRFVSSSGEMSVRTACKIEMFPPVIPLIALEIKNSQ